MAQTQDRVFHSRRTTRVAALQTLCEVDSVDHPLDDVLTYAKQSWSLSGPADRFLGRLAGGVLENIGEIDKIITEFAPSWPISQMAIVDRNLLRMGIYEISMGLRHRQGRDKRGRGDGQGVRFRKLSQVRKRRPRSVMQAVAVRSAHKPSAHAAVDVEKAPVA